jgi:hypothetical protein
MRLKSSLVVSRDVRDTVAPSVVMVLVKAGGFVLAASGRSSELLNQVRI